MNRISQVRDCKAPHDAAWIIHLAVLALITFTQPACLLPIPLAIYPEIEPGSGSIIEIYDRSGRPIRTNGLLIIHRKYSLVGLEGAPSNTLIPIRRGKAMVPVEVAIGSIGFLVGVHPCNSPFLWVPFALPVLESGAGTPTAIILVPGFNVEVRSWGTPEDNKPSRIVLFTKPAKQSMSWNKVYHSLRRRFEKQKPQSIWDLRFDHYHYWKARNFIEAELRRMNTLPDETNAASSGAGQDETSHSIAR